MPVSFSSTNIFLKGLSWSTPLLSVMLKLILIFVFACSFFYSSSEPALFWWWIVKQQECFLSSCGLTHNICFPFDRFWNRNSWERKWWLHDGSKISSLQKSSTYPPSNLSPRFSEALSLFYFPHLISSFLCWLKSKQSHLIVYCGRDCKVFIEPMWKWFSCNLQ